MHNNRKWYGAGSAGGGGRRGLSTAGSSGYTLSMNHYHYYDRYNGGANKFSSNLVLLLLVGFLFFTAQFIIVSKINPDSLMNPKHHKSKYSALENLDTGGRNFLINKHMKEHEKHVLEARQRRDREQQQQEEAAKIAASKHVKIEEVRKGPPNENLENGGETISNQDNSKTAASISHTIEDEHGVDENSATNVAEKDLIKSPESEQGFDTKIDESQPNSDSMTGANVDEQLEPHEFRDKNTDVANAEKIEQNLQATETKNSKLSSETDPIKDPNDVVTNKNAKIASENEQPILGSGHEKSNQAKEFETEAQTREQFDEKKEQVDDSNVAAAPSENVEKKKELDVNAQEMLNAEGVESGEYSEGKSSFEKKANLVDPTKHLEKAPKAIKHSPEEI